MYEKLSALLRKKGISSRDFLLIQEEDSKPVKVEKWNENELGVFPSKEELDAITEQEIQEETKYKICKNYVDIVEDLKYIENPLQGAIVYKNGEVEKDRGLFVYINNTWVKVV